MLQELFGTNKPIIGVIHLLPLPGSPRWDGRMDPVCLRAEQEAAALTTGGVDAIIVENFFDAPFTRGRVDTSGLRHVGSRETHHCDMRCTDRHQRSAQ